MFISPLDLGDAWPLTILPLCYLAALVYQTVRLSTLEQLWWRTFVTGSKLLGVIIGLSIVIFFTTWR